MLKIEDFEKGQTWITTAGPRRIVKVLDVGTIDLMVGGSNDDEKPPERKTFRSIRVKATTPIYKVPGHVDADEADITRQRRKVIRANFGDDMWEETWVEITRKKLPIENPRLKAKGWEQILQVHSCQGRHERNEGQYKGQRIAGTLVDGIKIPPEDVHAKMFDTLDAEEVTQREKEQAVHDAKVIKRWQEQQALEARDARLGDCADNKKWAPVARLKMQAKICHLQVEDTGDGKLNHKFRHAIAEYLRSLGINPWEVYELGKEEFKARVDEARMKMPV